MVKLRKLRIRSNANQIWTKVNELEGATKNLVGVQARTIGLRMKENAMLLAPIDTTRLISSIHLKQKTKGVFRVSADTPYAIFQEKGVKPHWVHKDMLNGWDRRNPNVQLSRDEFLFVGGPNSRIKKGNSDNKFFRKAFEKTLNEGVVQRASLDAKNKLIKVWSR